MQLTVKSVELGSEGLSIVKYPDERLLTKSQDVSDFGAALHKTLDAMWPLMEANKGIGLAANQVGITQRFFILKDEKGRRWEFINPEVVDREGNTTINEGCLSAPGAFVQVPRAQTVTVKARDRFGAEFQVVCQDLEAVCIQHEIDHLDGIFFLSKTSRQQRRAALKSLGF